MPNTFRLWDTPHLLLPGARIRRGQPQQSCSGPVKPPAEKNGRNQSTAATSYLRPTGQAQQAYTDKVTRTDAPRAAPKYHYQKRSCTQPRDHYQMPIRFSGSGHPRIKVFNTNSTGAGAHPERSVFDYRESGYSASALTQKHPGNQAGDHPGHQAKWLLGREPRARLHHGRTAINAG